MAIASSTRQAVGRAMKKSGLPREEIFLEIKLWPSFYEQPDAVEKTLQRLDTDYIDLLLIHQPAGNYIAGYCQMEKAYQEGKVRAIGLSNFKKEQIEEILAICAVKPTVLQTELHPYHQEPELKAFLKEQEILAQSWYPLGHGDKALLDEPLFTELGQKYDKSNENEKIDRTVPVRGYEHFSAGWLRQCRAEQHSGSRRHQQRALHCRAGHFFRRRDHADLGRHL
jgi:diketogulonate reductase-like aldo/keto reductase